MATIRRERCLEYYDRLFANYGHLDDQKFREIARELKLDMEIFERDMNDSATIARVNKDIYLGSSVGVRGTPTIFINGSIKKARTMENFQAIVVKELEKDGKRADLREGQVRE